MLRRAQCFPGKLKSVTNACHIPDPNTVRVERLLPASADAVRKHLAPEPCVRFELEQCGAEVLLRVTQDDIPAAATARCAAEWQARLDALAFRLRGQEPPPFPALLERYLPAYTHSFAALPEVARYTCYRAPSPIRIDGKLDDPAWQRAPVSPAFADIVTGEPAWFDTRVRMLWDDEYLYFGVSAEETDVWGTLTERDSKIYEENDLEIFIAGRDAYYEFEINALNTIYEAFWIWKDVHKPGGPYWGRPEFDPRTQRIMVLDGVGGHVHPRGERWGFLDWDCAGLKTAVHVDGTVNKRDGGDRGWSAEIAVPWASLALIADGRSLPPQDGDVWRIDCSRFEKIGRRGETLDPCAGWTWSPHGHYDSHIPEIFPVVTFSTARP